MTSPHITITQKASEKIISLMLRDDQKPFLKIITYMDDKNRLKPKLSFTDCLDESAIRLNIHPLTLVISPEDAPSLDGLVIDYSDALIGGGFKFQKPKPKAQCSCGKALSL